MKLILRSFSQEVDIADLTKANNYLVFQEEYTGHLFRLTVPAETIAQLSEYIVSDGELKVGEPVAEEPELEVPEDEEIPDNIVAPKANGRKRLQQSPRSEDEVASL